MLELSAPFAPAFAALFWGNPVPDQREGRGGEGDGEFWVCVCVGMNLDCVCVCVCLESVFGRRGMGCSWGLGVAISTRFRGTGVGNFVWGCVFSASSVIIDLVQIGGGGKGEHSFFWTCGSGFCY